MQWVEARGGNGGGKRCRRRKRERGGGGGGRLANVEGGRNVRIITRTPWNPWHRGDGKRDRQIRTIAGVSRTALSVMVVVLLPSPPAPLARRFSRVLSTACLLAPLFVSTLSLVSISRVFSFLSRAPNLSRARNIQTPSPTTWSTQTSRPPPVKYPP